SLNIRVPEIIDQGEESSNGGGDTLYGVQVGVAEGGGEEAEGASNEVDDGLRIVEIGSCLAEEDWLHINGEVKPHKPHKGVDDGEENGGDGEELFPESQSPLVWDVLLASVNLHNHLGVEQRKTLLVIKFGQRVHDLGSRNGDSGTVVDRLGHKGLRGDDEVEANHPKNGDKAVNSNNNLSGIEPKERHIWPFRRDVSDQIDHSLHVGKAHADGSTHHSHDEVLFGVVKDGD
ncbi:hypothetical protein OIY81_3595, partial [Cryptosporidium canis]